MAFSGMINVKTGQLTLGGQFEAYKRGQLERKIQITRPSQPPKPSRWSWPAIPCQKKRTRRI